MEFSGSKMRKWLLVVFATSVIVCLVILSIPVGCFEGEAFVEEDEVLNPDTLTILTHRGPDKLDPATCSRYDEVGYLVIQNLYDRLISQDRTGSEITGRLAKEVIPSPDGMEYTFYLREDATFHDGAPVTAYAVKYSFDRVLWMNQDPAWMMAQCMDLDSTQVIDEYTVRITLTEPYAAFLSILCQPVASIVNPTAVEEHGGVAKDEDNEWLNQNEYGAGSGPYELVELVHDEYIVLERYDYYWRDPAKLPNVYIRFIPEMVTQIMYLVTGEADIAIGFPEINLSDIVGNEGVIYKMSYSYDITFIVLGCRGPLADKKVRQAVCMAMDLDEILSSVYHGNAYYLGGPVPSGMFGGLFTAPYHFDLDASNVLLDEAGYSWGILENYRADPRTREKLGAEIVILEGDTERLDIALLWQANLAEIGFDLEIREVSSVAEMYESIRNEETDMIISGWLFDYADPDNFTDPLCSSANAKTIWGSDYKNEELDALIDQAKWESDKDTRDDLYYQIHLIIKEDAPFVWLAQIAHIDVMRTWIQGYSYNPSQTMEFWGIYKESPQPAEDLQPTVEPEDGICCGTLFVSLLIFSFIILPHKNTND